jgi:hypothetical protein
MPPFNDTTHGRRPVGTSTTVTDPEACPYCRLSSISSARQATSTLSIRPQAVDLGTCDGPL